MAEGFSYVPYDARDNFQPIIKTDYRARFGVVGNAGGHDVSGEIVGRFGTFVLRDGKPHVSETIYVRRTPGNLGLDLLQGIPHNGWSGQEVIFSREIRISEVTDRIFSHFDASGLQASSLSEREPIVIYAAQPIAA